MANPSQHISYDYTIAKWFMFACIVFGIIGMGIGTLIAFQLAEPSLNDFAGEYSKFGRLRPLHTNGVVYGFMLSGIWATWYYVGQRVLKVSMRESKLLMFLGKAHFVIFMITILLAVVSLFAGVTTSKEYAELEWPFDIAVVVIWVLWGMGIFGLIGIRREKSLYISIWYYIATFLGVAMLYLFNNMEVPTRLVTGMGSWLHSVSMYAGSNDALIQWWWGHNAVAFVFTVAIIAEIYYFLPKESGQPIFSYKLSLFSFWSLMFIYLWAGGHHLIYSTVPDWMQTMGSIFSVVLILPSWGSAINILLTMKGEWHQLKESPLIKFMIFASTFYMFSTLEGSIQSVKSINALAHFTDWIPGHVHDGTLGWVGFMTMAALYHMTPRVFKKEIYSKKIMEMQFWIQTIGIVFYFSSMWIAGITQGMMWRAVDDNGTLLYSFMDTVDALKPYYWIKAIGGLLYLIGFFMFAYNIYKSITSNRSIEVEPKSASPMQA
ncbi:cytochrome-c oxidase, cbb3-type subunit I [Campylobacter canadensis]|uniref:cytochrome-c oxidase, cbb3-type subunit I n=1 Tax=Campylobacter canadensis TaxID=449520 RepID=UPI00155598D9|nr:cytochrome-c oxidase, cbb3-type subunit I [Campylobacter canadensis]MBZ7994288.1 cytochrome-c oxidase, cbb3-type subunit I [Campylobacter canadensis]MBZ7995720.1 cytochrome-c oxidase, cbb3-type subunit I [Campylobacter canadensis]MBZ7999620.1 cytochrome-c oxidase, cbb3-type subunit I [Campylobacter canadensis]MBZ8001293.1 cytochrome-c oxidase, cbb3-type subunit I [Campylobacter canadensis]MBZ8004310.1 cytochrome-c oxidase, cbb3-type subunit I [Campylobacter canadensis]